MFKWFFHKKSSFATSQTKYCFFHHPGFGGAGRWNLVFCNKSNEILLFGHFFFLREIDQKLMFCNKSNEILLFLLFISGLFSFFFAFGPLFGFVFCNKSNGILRFYDFSKKYHFSWKCLLFDANFSFFTFCFKTCIILHIFSQF